MTKKIIKFIVDGYIAWECRYFTKRERPKRKRVLLFRKDGLGDFIIFFPFLKYYRDAFQDYEMTIVLPRVASGLRPLLSDFDHIIEFDARRFSRSFFYRRNFIKTLVRQNYDTAIYPVFSREPIGDLIISLTGAQTRIGFAKNNQPESGTTYTQIVTVPTGIQREIDLNTVFTTQVTGQKILIELPTIDVNLFPAKGALSLSQKYALKSGQYAVIFVGAAAHYRVWPEERFARVCDYLTSRHLVPVICGGPGDAETAARVINHSQNPKGIINLTGQTDLASLAHILKQARLYFGNETGALHLAVALDTPALCLLGGGVFGRFFPYGDPHRHLDVHDPNMTCLNDYWACGQRCVGDQRAPCIMGITTDNALNKLKQLLTHNTLQSKP